MYRVYAFKQKRSVRKINIGEEEKSFYIYDSLEEMKQIL